MKPRLLIDMNLSRAWESFLGENGFDAIHWSSVGDPRAPDAEIMRWALENERVVFTNDLDFGTALALTHAAGPSVIQIRALDIRPRTIGRTLLGVLGQCSDALTSGALVIVDEERMRVRSLPFRE